MCPFTEQGNGAAADEAAAAPTNVELLLQSVDSNAAEPRALATPAEADEAARADALKHDRLATKTVDRIDDAARVQQGVTVLAWTAPSTADLYDIEKHRIKDDLAARQMVVRVCWELYVLIWASSHRL